MAIRLPRHQPPPALDSLIGGQHLPHAEPGQRRGSSKPWTQITFEIGTITKVCTGLLLADLAEQGLVSLDVPLRSYLPASAQVPAFQDQQITLGDLASHVSGRRRDPRGTLRRWLGDRHNPNTGLSVEAMYEGVARTKLRRRPDRTHAASPAPDRQAHRGRARLADRPPARGCRPPALAQRRDQPLSQLRRRQPGDRHRRGRAQQHRPVVDRLGLRLVKALSTHAS
jgi:hypothetical protein